MFATTTKFSKDDITQGNLTGKFPYLSTSGNLYVYIVYHYDSNAILVTPLKNRQAGTIKDAWINSANQLSNRGALPSMFILDNKCSAET